MSGVALTKQSIQQGLDKVFQCARKGNMESATKALVSISGLDEKQQGIILDMIRELGVSLAQEQLANLEFLNALTVSSKKPKVDIVSKLPACSVIALAHLSLPNIARAARVCKSWHKITNDPGLWKRKAHDLRTSVGKGQVAKDSLRDAIIFGRSGRTRLVDFFLKSGALGELMGNTFIRSQTGPKFTLDVVDSFDRRTCAVLRGVFTNGVIDEVLQIQDAQHRDTREREEINFEAMGRGFVRWSSGAHLGDRYRYPDEDVSSQPARLFKDDVGFNKVFALMRMGNHGCISEKQALDYLPRVMIQVNHFSGLFGPSFFCPLSRISSLQVQASSGGTEVAAGLQTCGFNQAVSRHLLQLRDALNDETDDSQLYTLVEALRPRVMTEKEMRRYLDVLVPLFDEIRKLPAANSQEVLAGNWELIEKLFDTKVLEARGVARAFESIQAGLGRHPDIDVLFFTFCEQLGSKTTLQEQKCKVERKESKTSTTTTTSSSSSGQAS